jgi:uncharacterized protein (DUF362 family)/NAD-dependent dihydropyrimidine dehydrogenase PreA subunit
MIYYSKIEKYDKNILKEHFEESFKKFDKLIKNDKIFIKPNLISPKNPEKAVTTHPVFVEALSEYLIDNNNKIFIGDSPGVGSLGLNLKISKYDTFIKRLNINVIPFKEKTEIIREENKVLKRFHISKVVKDFEHIINVAKLKTHIMTGLTLSVKNLYGCIVGKDKVFYHLKAGHNIDLFADILIDIYETVKPCINFIDGIWGMEGNGPTSGDAEHFKIFASSVNGYILDRAIELVSGFPGKTVITKQAEKRGLIAPDFNIDFNEYFKIKPPKTKSANFNVPTFLVNIFSVKPSIDNKMCKLCLKCFNSCPPKAIYKYNDKLKIDYNKCIKCFCCHELCVHNAVKLKRFF